MLSLLSLFTMFVSRAPLLSGQSVLRSHGLSKVL